MLPFNAPLPDFERCPVVTEQIGSLASFPLQMSQATTYAKPGLALVGDAAHTIHPLAGQGANLGFMDVACLAQVLREAQSAQKDCYQFKTLRRYERWRKSENELMLFSMNAFKSVFSSRSPVCVGLRSAGLTITDRFDWLKRYFIKFALHESFP